MKHHATVAFAATLVVAGLTQSAFAQIRAFPEAEGFGAHVTGGRGGTVYHVTNLNNSGAGSFRDAVSQPNRIVVFEVGGYINLTSSVTVQPNITIAGQTAPGQGIATRGATVSFSAADNTIVRNMRFRYGVVSGGDAVTADGVNGLIIDHVSAQWGQDESFSITNSSNVTVQNTLIGEGLLNHSMGSLIEWNTISMHHNLYMSNNSRNPKTKGVNDFVNNVIYNWGSDPYIAGDSAGISEANVINNYFVRGPSSGSDPDPFSRGNANYRLYIEGNHYDQNRNGVIDGTLVTQASIDDPMTFMSQRFNYPAVRTDSARKAYDKVVASVGASLVRDSVDQRMINELTSGGGLIISNPNTQTPGFGTITGGAAPTDTDRDGMPDAWETARGLNPASAADRNNIAPSGYTRVEEYINDLMSATNPQRVWSSTSGNWNTNANWTAGSLPDTDADAFIRAASPSSNPAVTINSGSASAFRLFIGEGGATEGARVTVETGGTLDVPFLIQVGHQNTGTLNVNGGTINTWAIALGNTLNGFFNGTLNLSAGTIRAGRISPGGTGSFLWSGGTLTPLGNTLTVTQDVSITGNGTFDTASAGNITVSGILSGTGGINVIGNGTLNLTNSANSYTGPTVVQGATLVISSLNNGGSPGNLGAASSAPGNLVLAANAVLQFAANSTSNRAITINAGGATLRTNNAITFTLSGPINHTDAGNRSLTIDLAGSASNISTLSGSIADSTNGKLSLIKNGSARLSLNGSAKTYSGDTIINAGSVLAFATNVLPFGPGKGNLIINAGANLDVRNGININGLIGTGNLINGSGGSRTVTLGNGDANGQFSGPITQGNSIHKVGAGTQILSGTNTYTGTTIISAGVLSLGPLATQPILGGTAVPNPAGADIRGGRLEFTDAAASSTAQTILGILDAGFDVQFLTGPLRSTNLTTGRTLGWINDTANAKIVVAQTWRGDTNLDGAVNFIDLLALARNYGITNGAVWIDGDTNYDGAVNFTDLLDVARNYGAGATPQLGTQPNFAADWARAQAIVPEPSAALLLLAGTALQRRTSHRTSPHSSHRTSRCRR